MTKKCIGPLCQGREKPLTEFGTDKTQPDGHNFYCKECIKYNCAKYRNSQHGKQQRNISRHTSEYKQYMKDYQKTEQRKSYLKKESVRQRKKQFASSYFKTARGRATTMWNNIKRRAGKDKNYKHVKILITRKEFIRWAIPEIEKFLLEFPNKKPSIDRIQVDGHYEMGNIRIIDIQENVARSRFIAHAVGLNKNSTKPQIMEKTAMIINSVFEAVGMNTRVNKEWLEQSLEIT